LTKKGCSVILIEENEMISEMKDNKIHVVFDIGEYDPEVIDFLTFLEITSKSKATDEDIEELSEEIKRNWWEENKKRFLDEDESGN
jgi:hypothetical protein